MNRDHLWVLKELAQRETSPVGDGMWHLAWCLAQPLARAGQIDLRTYSGETVAVINRTGLRTATGMVRRG